MGIPFLLHACHHTRKRSRMTPWGVLPMQQHVPPRSCPIRWWGKVQQAGEKGCKTRTRRARRERRRQQRERKYAGSARANGTRRFTRARAGATINNNDRRRRLAGEKVVVKRWRALSRYAYGARAYARRRNAARCRKGMRASRALRMRACAVCRQAWRVQCVVVEKVVCCARRAAASRRRHGGRRYKQGRRVAASAYRRSRRVQRKAAAAGGIAAAEGARGVMVVGGVAVALRGSMGAGMAGEWHTWTPRAARGA